MLSIYWRVTTILAVGLLCCPSAGWGQEKQLQDPPTAAGAGGEQAALAVVPTGQVAVLYQNAEVMIVSHRAPLIEVLREVCSQIGAELDAPPELDVPILGVFGPGPARDVLTAMMGGSHFNLAMAGSPEDPNAIVRIVILAKSADSAEKTNNGSDAPPAQDSLAQATEQPGTQATEPPIPSTPTASEVEARISQVRELFAQAQGELAQVAGLANLDMDSLLKEAEAQAKASAAEDDLDAPPPKSSAAAAPINHPRGRRHRH
jgi:hypothetical protein